jgi:hypothetical protein
MGLKGSWYCNWVTRSCRKASMPSPDEDLPVVELAELPEVEDKRLST